MECLICKTEFEYPNFGPCKKQPGNHTVTSKTYVHGGSRDIQNIRDRRKFSPVVFLRADTEVVGTNGERVHTSPLIAEFSDARFSTGDPEVQWWMDNAAMKKFPIFAGEEGEQVWRKNQLSTEQQSEIANRELVAIQRQVKEQNELLATVKARR